MILNQKIEQVCKANSHFGQIFFFRRKLKLKNGQNDELRAQLSQASCLFPIANILARKATLPAKKKKGGMTEVNNKGRKALSSSKQRGSKPSAKHELEWIKMLHSLIRRIDRCHRRKKPLADYVVREPATSCSSINPPGVGWKTRDWRIERCTMREKVRKGLFQKKLSLRAEWCENHK